MEWDKITSQDFRKAVEQTKVCLLPIGCLEKHGDHLPLGTDIVQAHRCACSAAEIEPAIVFPPYYFGAVPEVRHQPGTIALSSKLLIDLLENICDEIGRNGVPKILIVNAHGGNRPLLLSLAQILLDKKKPYLVYFSNTFEFCPGTKCDGHGGECESSLMMYLAQDTVKSGVGSEDGFAQNRFEHLHAVSLTTALDWYADFPNHLSSKGIPGSVQAGEQYFRNIVSALVNQINAVKEDNTLKALYSEFHSRAANL